MSSRLFGTDGIRGVAGQFPLRPSDVYQLGLSAGSVLRKKHKSKTSRVLVVRDTRASGEWIIKKLSQGLREQGIDVYDAGVLSTPSVAYLVKARGFHAGVVVSASHNPPEFNGIKFFTPEGRKWPDPWEREAEAIFASKKYLSSPARTGLLITAGSLHDDYEGFLISTLKDSSDLSTLRVALDCSNGANSFTAPQALRRLGAEVFVIGAKPNGKNINVGCGSQKTGKLSSLVKKKKCHLGIAFDGDGDRVILVDEKGRELDGDHIIALLANHFKTKKILKRNTVVITVMANLGLKKALGKMGVRALEVAVGDRYVSEMMRKTGAVLGGEQSGHIILGAHLPTGDGLLTALHCLSLLKEAKKPLSVMVAHMKKYPQILKNVPVKERKPLNELPGVEQIIKSIETKMGDDGRVLVRYSGTEPLLRIMIEGPDKKELEVEANRIAHAVTAVNGNGSARHQH